MAEWQDTTPPLFTWSGGKTLRQGGRHRSCPLCDLLLAGLHLSFSIWEVGVALVVAESAQLSSGAFYRGSRALWTCGDCAALPSTERSVLPLEGGQMPPDVLPLERGQMPPDVLPWEGGQTPPKRLYLKLFALFK